MHHTEDDADQPQYQRGDSPGSPAAGGDTTAGAGQRQPTDNRADQPHRNSDKGPGSPGGNANLRRLSVADSRRDADSAKRDQPTKNALPLHLPSLLPRIMRSQRDGRIG